MKLLLFILCFFGYFAFGQNFNDDFKPYNKKRIAPILTKWIELNGYSVITMDIDYKESTDGNIVNGINYGLGFNYMFNIGLDDLPQKIGIGLGAEIHPTQYFKYNLGFNHKILSIGSENVNASFIGSEEINLVFNTQHQYPQMNVILYLLEAQYKNWEVKWGLQSYWDRFIPISFVDHSFNVFKVGYKLEFK